MSDSGARKYAAIEFAITAILSVIFMIFFGFFVFGEYDNGESCYVQRVWSPAQQGYVTRKTTFPIEGGSNIDIAWRFNVFFIFGFIN